MGLVSDNRKTDTSQTADRVLLLLKEIARADRPIGVSRAAALLGVSTSAAHRLLRSLTGAGLVEQEESRGYVLGPGVLGIAQRYLQSIDVREHARPLLLELRDTTEETTCLIVRRGESRVCVDYALSRHKIAYIPHLGETLPITMGATGRAFLSTLRGAEQRRLLSELQPYTNFEDVGVEDALRLIDEGRERGYFVSTSERIAGMNGAALPLLDSQGRLAATVSIVGPANRWTGERIDEVCPRLLPRVRAFSHIEYHLTED